MKFDQIGQPYAGCADSTAATLLGRGTLCKYGFPPGDGIQFRLPSYTQVVRSAIPLSSQREKSNSTFE